MKDMTILSREMYEKAIRPGSIKEAAAILREYGQYRSLADVLRAFSTDEKLGRTLSDGLLLWFPETKSEAMSRKIRNWLGGQVQSIRKEDAFAVSRVLHLPLEKTDEFLRMASGEGIHWRDPQEIVWAYAALNDYGPEETKRLLQRLGDFGQLPGAEANPQVDSYTEEVEYILRPSLRGTEDELLEAIKQQWDKLGSAHNMAYVVFTQLTELLEKGYSYFEAERDEAPKEITAREMLESFLYRRIVPVAQRGSDKGKGFSALQRSIRENWPDEASLSKMKKRQLEVSRKTLALLFLATDGSGSDYEDLSEQDEALSRDEIFENMYMRMELMLRSCGFAGLDPRQPFDWLVLYCMSAGDSWEIDEKMQSLLENMFPEKEPDNENIE